MISSLPDTSHLKRSDLLPTLVEAAMKIVLRSGVDEKIQGIKGTVRIAKVGDMQLVFRGPKADILNASSSFGIDVWYRQKKALSVCWNSNLFKDYELISLKRGPWIAEVFKHAEDQNSCP